MQSNTQSQTTRRNQLIEVAEKYFESLRKGSFETIPYNNNVTLRTPLTPGGVDEPVKGKQALHEVWWQPLVPALSGVTIEVLDHYINEECSAIISEANITLASPAITLRVADRFTIDENGLITDQENHFDASALRG